MLALSVVYFTRAVCVASRLFDSFFVWRDNASHSDWTVPLPLLFAIERAGTCPNSSRRWCKTDLTAPNHLTCSAFPAVWPLLWLSAPRHGHTTPVNVDHGNVCENKQSGMDFIFLQPRACDADVAAWQPGLVPATSANVQLASKYVAHSTVHYGSPTQWTQDPSTLYPTSRYRLRSHAKPAPK